MKITVRLRGPLAKQFREGNIEIECEEGTILLDLLSNLLEKNEDVRGVWSSPEVMDRDALILCNESDIGLTGGLETTIKDGDVLVVLPLIHGG
ncbi:MAG: MoaD/ThiS family protein [Candidatus Thorarchaeota archaeon]|jgi:molybdopterin converting factor small subunit